MNEDTKSQPESQERIDDLESRIEELETELGSVKSQYFTSQQENSQIRSQMASLEGRLRQSLITIFGDGTNPPAILNGVEIIALVHFLFLPEFKK